MFMEVAHNRKSPDTLFILYLCKTYTRFVIYFFVFQDGQRHRRGNGCSWVA